MKALIVVDVQNDFCPVSDEDYKNGNGGSLAVPDGNLIVPVINKLLPKFDLIIFTKDWHPEKMDAFASSHKGKKPFDTYINKEGVTDTLWPDHCVADTIGAQLHDDINFDLIKGEFYIFKKGTNKNQHPYSGFGAEGLTDFLKERNVTETIILGLALDFCVLDTANDSVKNGFDTTLVLDGTKPITEKGGINALDKMINNNITITFSDLL
jgi:nicotinamidase/pyrazinamidase